MLPILTSFLDHYSDLLQPIFFLCAWLLFALFISTIINAVIDITKRSQVMHQIPCHSCQYFTRSYYLKCTVNPLIANTESAVNCLDFQQKSN